MDCPLVEEGGAFNGDQVQLEELWVFAELCIHEAIKECRISLKMVLPIRLVQFQVFLDRVSHLS